VPPLEDVPIALETPDLIKFLKIIFILILLLLILYMLSTLQFQLLMTKFYMQ